MFDWEMQVLVIFRNDVQILVVSQTGRFYFILPNRSSWLIDKVASIDLFQVHDGGLPPKDLLISFQCQLEKWCDVYPRGGVFG